MDFTVAVVDTRFSATVPLGSTAAAACVGVESPDIAAHPASTSEAQSAASRIVVAILVPPVIGFVDRSAIVRRRALRVDEFASPTGSASSIFHVDFQPSRTHRFLEDCVVALRLIGVRDRERCDGFVEEVALDDVAADLCRLGGARVRPRAPHSGKSSVT
jgi:hypothetical protein